MTGADLERAVAAVLQAGGWFLLRGASDEDFQAFELDVLGYRFDGGAESSVVVESKGGKSGFGDLWKLVGLKAHLEIGRGVLLADTSSPFHGQKLEYASKHAVEIIDRVPTGLGAALAEAGVVAAEPDEAVLNAWQHCFRVEDGLVATLNDKGLWSRYETIRLAKAQLQHLMTKAWLEADPWRQALGLYGLFQDEPKIARRMAEEMGGAGGADALMTEAMYRGASPEIQACFYLEHRKRIAVAFAATRCAASGAASVWEAQAPAAFRAMVDEIRRQGAWYLPTALRTFFLGFGAMVCTIATDEEYAHIGGQAGCTAAEARRSLELFDELLPTPGGWFYEAYDLSRLKLTPTALRGAGLTMREAVYGREWTSLATADQLKVAGPAELARAAEAEQRVLPQRRLLARARRARP